MKHKHAVPEGVSRRPTHGKEVHFPARSVRMYLCQRIGVMRLREIAKIFEIVSFASAGATVRFTKQRLLEDRQLDRGVNYIMLDLTL